MPLGDSVALCNFCIICSSFWFSLLRSSTCKQQGARCQFALQQHKKGSQTELQADDCRKEQLGVPVRRSMRMCRWLLLNSLHKSLCWSCAAAGLPDFGRWRVAACSTITNLTLVAVELAAFPLSHAACCLPVLPSPAGERQRGSAPQPEVSWMYIHTACRCGGTGARPAGASQASAKHVKRCRTQMRVCRA